jgi:hypothetical protein
MRATAPAPTTLRAAVQTFGSTVFLLAAFALIGIAPSLLIDFTLRNLLTVLAILVIAAGGALIAGKDA